MSLTPRNVAEKIKDILNNALHGVNPHGVTPHVVTSRKLPFSSEEAINFCKLWGNPEDRAAIQKMVGELFTDSDRVFARRVDHSGRFIFTFEVEACDGDLFIIPHFVVRTPYSTGDKYMEAFSAPQNVDTPAQLCVTLPAHCVSPWHVVAHMMANLGLVVHDDQYDQYILGLALLDNFGDEVPPEGFKASLVYGKAVLDLNGVAVRVPQIVITETEKTMRARLGRSDALKKRLLEALEECPAIIKRHKANPQGEKDIKTEAEAVKDLKEEDIKKEVIVIT